MRVQSSPVDTNVIHGYNGYITFVPYWEFGIHLG